MTQKKIDKMNILQRAASPTPKFFKKLKIVGLVLTAIGGTLIAAPIALPAIVLNVAGYITLAGAVTTAVSQVTVEG